MYAYRGKCIFVTISLDAGTGSVLAGRSIKRPRCRRPQLGVY